MARLEIASIKDDPRSVGRPLMRDHNLSARIWATVAVAVVPFASGTTTGWWLPLHLALVGAASQAIVGGQLMFSVTLGLSRGPRRWVTLTQLAFMNVGAALVVGGRLWGSRITLAAGATFFVIGVGWALWQVDRLWRRSVNRRFAITGTFYRLAGWSILIGASIGAALGIGAFDDGLSYVSHRNIHMTINVLGWAGMTIVGTAITLLPTILHVRAGTLGWIKAVPWLMFGGLLAFATTASLRAPEAAGVGLLAYVIGLAVFGGYVRRILVVPRRRCIPTAALHLVMALAWLVVTSVAVTIALALEDDGAVRDVLVTGGAAGTIFQALLGAWSFLLPSLRAPIPDRRRRELVAMELGGRTQVGALNAGLILTLIGSLTAWDVLLIGIWLAWLAAASALTKSWTFPLLAKLQIVRSRSDRWWAVPEG